MIRESLSDYVNHTRGYSFGEDRTFDIWVKDMAHKQKYHNIYKLPNDAKLWKQARENKTYNLQKVYECCQSSRYHQNNSLFANNDYGN